MAPRDPDRFSTTDGQPPHPEYSGDNSPAPQPVDASTGQHRAYWVLSDAELARGLVRPVRRSYRHLACGGTTTMTAKIAETYAREPAFYTATFCVHCMDHFPVAGFRWEGSDEVVGS